MCLKDWLNFFSTIITVLAGYKIILIQINKNRTKEFIDKLESEIINYYNLCYGPNVSYYEINKEEIAYSVNKLEILLDENNKLEKKLIAMLRNSVIEIINSNQGSYDCKKIIELAKLVIREKSNKLYGFISF